ARASKMAARTRRAYPLRDSQNHPGGAGRQCSILRLMSWPASFTAAPASLIFAPTVDAASLTFAPTVDAASLTFAPTFGAACDTLSISLWTAVFVFTVARSILSLVLSFVPI